MPGTHPLAAVAKRRDRVARTITQTASALGLDAARAAEAVLAVLPPGTDYAALYKSLLPLHGKPPDPQAVRQLAWAVAGNLKALRAGRPVYPPLVPQQPAPAVLQVLAAAPVARRAKPGQPAPDPRTRYRVRAVQGAACPLEFEVVWSDKYVRYLARHPQGFGFLGRVPKTPRGPLGRPYQHPATLVGMLFAAGVGLGKDARPALTGVRCTPSQRAYNRALTELRFRAGGFRCPFGFAHKCQDCPKGQASCPAACRPLDLVPLQCPACRQAGHADPAWPRTGVCTRCAALGRRPPTQQEARRE